MEGTQKPLSSPTEEDYSTDEEEEELQKLLPTLEQETYWNGKTLFKYKGFWYYSIFLKPILGIERYFKPRDTDILLTSMPKSGTTWLKALTYSIANRSVHSPIDQINHPLFTSNPHDLVPFLESTLYAQRNPNLEDMPSPRIFATHLAYSFLRPSIDHEPPCKIIHICRNPMDRFVSHRHFLLDIGYADRDAKALFMEESLEEFGSGIVCFGPSWEHALGYWNAHLKSPNKVLFLKYEDLKKDDHYYIKKIAEFIGFPFSPEEVESGLVEKISKLCSFENLSEANKEEGLINAPVVHMKKSSFFRKGEVGDWTNYLSKEMAQRMKDVMESKLEGSGLTLDYPGL